MPKLENTAGMLRSVGPLRNPAFLRPALSPSLNRITPTAPAACAFASFCTNAHVPRWISEIAPAVAAGKSSGAQPAVLPPGLGITLLVTGTTGAVTSLVGENS